MNRPSPRQAKRKRIQARWRRDLALLQMGLNGLQFESVTVHARIRDYGWCCDVTYVSTWTSPLSDEPMVKRYLQTIEAQRMRKNGLKRAMLSPWLSMPHQYNYLRAVLTRALQYAVDEGTLPANPMRSIEAHATELLDHSTSAVTKRHYRAAPKRVAPVK